MLKSRLILAFLCLCPILAAAQKTDLPGSADHPMISRYPGLVITAYSVKDFDAFTFPLGKLNPSSSKFAKSQVVEGKVTRIYYEYPEDRTSLEISRNYETALSDCLECQAKLRVMEKTENGGTCFPLSHNPGCCCLS